MSAAGATLLLLALLAFAFAMLVAMSFVFARITGWRALARRFPAPRGLPRSRFRVRGAVLGEWGWNAPPLVAEIDEVGIVLAAVGPFGVAFRPVRVPWLAIVGLERRRYMFFEVAEMRYGDAGCFKIGFSASPFVDAIEARLAADAVV